MKTTGQIRKMVTRLADVAEYQLPLDNELISLNPLIGSVISLTHEGEIFCIACGRKTRKSFQQGYCFPCLRTLARCDSCIVRPEQCHYHEGTCREPEWGQKNCMQDHYVYLANSSGVKVGITRATQIPTRWIDQGACQALPIFRVENRYISGLLEVALKQHVSDRTNWRKMLQGEPDRVDLTRHRDQLVELCRQEIQELKTRFGETAITALADESAVDIHFPVKVYPAKVSSFNFDKTDEVNGKLVGIKGQYLILDTGVLNIRKFAGYRVSLQTK